MALGDKVGLGFALGAVLAVLILLTASAAGVIPRYTQRPAQLTEGPQIILRGPDVVRLNDDMILYSRYGKTVFHDNASNLNVTAWDNGTYVYDIENRREYKVAKELLDASISLNQVAWRENDTIRVRNIFNGSETVITSAAARPSGIPQIEGDRIVWADTRNGPLRTDIYSYNMTTGEEARLTPNSSFRGQPFLIGDMVVWTVDSSSIHAFHLSNSTEVALTDGGSGKFSPRASSRLVVWLDDRNARDPGRYDLFCLDLRNMREQQLTSGRAIESFDVSGWKVVWSDTTRKKEPGNSGDLYVFDLAKNRTKMFYSSQWSQHSPAIWGDRIVWVDGSKAGGEVFFMKKMDTTYAGMDLLTFVAVLLVLATALFAYLAHRRMVSKDEEDREAYEQKAAKRRRGRGLK